MTSGAAMVLDRDLDRDLPRTAFPSRFFVDSHYYHLRVTTLGGRWDRSSCYWCLQSAQGYTHNPLPPRSTPQQPLHPPLSWPVPSASVRSVCIIPKHLGIWGTSARALASYHGGRFASTRLGRPPPQWRRPPQAGCRDICAPRSLHRLISEICTPTDSLAQIQRDVRATLLSPAQPSHGRLGPAGALSRARRQDRGPRRD